MSELDLQITGDVARRITLLSRLSDDVPFPESLNNTIFNPVIRDLADIDFYKLTMAKYVLQHHQGVEVRYQLAIRKNVTFTQRDLAEIKRQVAYIGTLYFGEKSQKHIEKHAHYLGREFMDWLKGLRMHPEDVHLWLDKDGHLQCIVQGLYAKTIFWETYILAIINEIYNHHRFPALTIHQKLQVYKKAYNKGKWFRERKIHFVEFGTRRRYSTEVHRITLMGLIDGARNSDGTCYLRGTSNVMLSAEFADVDSGLAPCGYSYFDRPPQGTQAHEIYSVEAALSGLERANTEVPRKWAVTYPKRPGTLLPDTFTTKYFLRTCDPKYLWMYNSIRHDSDPDLFGWTDLVLDFLQALGIDTRTMYLLFSDGIDNFEIIEKIFGYRADECLKTFCIGTWFTNDLYDINGSSPIPAVIKVVAVRKSADHPWVHAAKISDNPKKAIGDKETIAEYNRKIFDTNPVPPLEDLVPGYKKAA